MRMDAKEKRERTAVQTPDFRRQTSDSTEIRNHSYISFLQNSFFHDKTAIPPDRHDTFTFMSFQAISSLQSIVWGLWSYGLNQRGGEVVNAK